MIFPTIYPQLRTFAVSAFKDEQRYFRLLNFEFSKFLIFPTIKDISARLRKKICDDDNKSKVGVIGSIGNSALLKSYISSSVAKWLMQMS